MTAERIREIICEWIDEYQKEKDEVLEKEAASEEIEYVFILAKLEVLNDLLEKIDEEEAKDESKK